MTYFGMQLQPKCADYFQDGIEAKAALTAERFVKAFARQPGVARDLRHAFGVRVFGFLVVQFTLLPFVHKKPSNNCKPFNRIRELFD